MNWKNIPSLAALRAFEAAARCGSYSVAARELNVTHAAIAQHVRLLEDHFGLRLMRRAGQGMMATDDGRALATSLSQGFGQIADGVRVVMDRNTARPLRVALTPSFAGNWLMPRIGAFWAAHPDITLEMSPSETVVDLRRDAFDLAVRYGRGTWPGVTSDRLVSAGHTVVAAPHLMGDRHVNSLADLRDQHWLMDVSREEEKLWAAGQGLDLNEVRLSAFDTNELVLQAVLAGHGISIMPEAVVERDVADGRLVALAAERDSTLAYHIVTRPDHVSERGQTFIRWLKKQAKAA